MSEPHGSGECRCAAPHVETLRLASSSGPYVVHVGPGSLAALRRTVGGPALVVTEPNVWERVGSRVEAALGAVGELWSLHVLPGGEASKALDAIAALWDALLRLGASRATRVVAVGGGTVGDAAGFAAATFHRGIPWVVVPTTLLAQADSAIGGKTAINLPGARNAVGAYHAPRAVVADTTLLATLPRRDVRSGLAEIVKMALLFDARLARRLDAHWDRLVEGDPEALAWAVARSIAHKGAVVARDEREERGERLLLNFGHTIGHALEAAAGFGALRHGEAVAAGMLGAIHLSEAVLGPAPSPDRAVARRLLARLLPTEVAVPNGLASADARDRVLAALSRDKKRVGGRLRWVLWRGIGRPALVEGVEQEAVRAAVDAALEALCRGFGTTPPRL